MKLGQTSVVYFFSKFGSSIAGFVATFYIARMLGAEGYGIYALALAVLAWLKIGGKIGVSSAITKRVSEGDEPDAYLVTGLAMMAGIFAIAAVAAIALRGPLESYIGAPILSILLILLAAELFRAFTSAALKGQHLVHVYAVLDPVNVTMRSALQIGVITVGFGVGGLLAAYAFASVAIALVSLFFVSVALVRPTLRHAKSLFEYAKYAWLGNLKKMSFSWIDVTVLGFFVSQALVGVYSVAWSIAAVLTIFSKGISTTLFPEISKISAQEDPSQVSTLVTDAIRYNGLFMIPGLVGAALVGERILLIYGPEFVAGSSVLLILIAARTIYGYQKQLVNTINGIDRPEIAFRINAVFVAVNVVLNVVLIWQYGWIGAAVATALAAAVTLVYAYYATCEFLEFDLPLQDVAYQCLAALLMGVVIYAMVVLGPPMEDSVVGHATTVVIIGIGAAVYFVALFVLSRTFRTTVSRNLPFDVPFAQ
ncbi:oligosaccharide flippase family protein [Natronorubrum bangense]|uniref:Polysaccharide biosynthesis protein n=2 Tax=Natronorubrum bangense TaxID=61858 RepID=L9WQV9_9EURY|nr:polysaccharide biosynthesis C-terminal domain-containing protein [Natronorubrum bangense]ELY51870.1 polysaccharide biosynthesis protein [Natronorubrum bangense JCM 10635]QCC54900.1 transporter [Natronorubrum bangense]